MGYFEVRPAIILRSILALAAALFVFAGGAGAQWPTWTADCTANVENPSTVSNSVVGGVTWKPALCQEFNEGITPGTAQFMDQNKSAWNYDTGGGGFGNNEVEIYCPPAGFAGGVPAGCPNGAATTNTEYIDAAGHLIIRAINNGVNNTGTWYSARVKSELTQNFKYGRIEANIELPNTTNQGLWPSFWSLGTDIDTGVAWPACGESDFMEVWSPSVDNGPGPGGNTSTIHTAVTGGSGLQPNGHFSFPGGEANDTAFHQYGIIWSTNMMQFYVDNAATPFYITTNDDLSSSDTWPFNAQIFVLLNMAVGGTLGGTPSALTPNPAVEVVDYVRQYTATIPAPTLGSPSSITVTAGATTGNTSTFTPSGTGYSFFTCSTTAPDASCGVTTDDALNHHVANGTTDTVTVTFNSTARSWLPYMFNPRRWSPRMQIAIPALLACMLVLLLLRRARTGLRYGLAIGSLVLMGAIIASCGGNGGGGGGGGGTTAGPYTITLNAFTESNTSGTPDATATINVTVM